MQTIDSLTFALLAASFFPLTKSDNSVNEEESELDEIGKEDNTLIIDDNSTTDSNDDDDDDDNNFCTQGDNEESFTFGSQAGLFTQALDSQELSDDCLEDLDNVGYALGIDDAIDDTHDEGDRETLIESDIAINCDAMNAKERDSSLGETTGFTEESDCHYLNENDNATSDDLNGTPEYAQFVEKDKGPEADVADEDQEGGKKGDCNEQKECSEATLLYEHSPNSSLLKSRKDFQGQEREFGDHEATGFTDDEEIYTSDKPDRIPSPRKGINPDTEIIASDETMCGVGKFDEMQPGFTESTQSQPRCGDKNSEKTQGDEDQTLPVKKAGEEEKDVSSGEIDQIAKELLKDATASSKVVNEGKGFSESMNDGIRSTVNKEQTTNLILEKRADAVQVQDDETLSGTNVDSEKGKQNEDWHIDRQIPATMALFSGDTQSIPSQFPLTLENGDRDEIASTSSKSLYTDDSFCAGSTEKISAGTTPSQEISTPAKGLNVETENQLVNGACDTLNFDCEVAGFIAPLKQDNLMPVGEEKKADLGESSKDNKCNDVQDKSILNLTSTPRDDYLSYPKDFLSIKSSGTDTLTNTPISQVLLEPQHQKISYASVVDKVSGLRMNKKMIRTDDAIDSSSDEDEDKVINDPSQNIDDLPKVQKEVPRQLNTSTFKAGSKMIPVSNTGWLKAKRKKPQGKEIIEREYDSNSSNENEQSADMNTFPPSADLSSDEEDAVIKKSNTSVSSCLIDTQTEDSGDDFDDEDDKPLFNLMKLRKGIPNAGSTANNHYSSSSSSDEENEFTDEATFVDPSQTTRAIESQLQKLDDLDIKTLTEKLLMAPVGENVGLKNQIQELTAENTDLRKKSKVLTKEKDSIKKQLLLANAQLKDKNALIAQMKKKLDDIQPILDAVLKISQPNNGTMRGNSSKMAKPIKPKKSPKATSKNPTPPSSNKTKTSPILLPVSHRKIGKIKAVVEMDEGGKEVYTTPKRKRDAASKNRANVVSISKQKTKKKSNVRGDMTFANLWKILKTEHGWKYKNAPMPLPGQVYVPPDGGVQMEDKVGIDFFEADDLLWKKAEELGIIDSDMNSQEDFEAVVEQRKGPSTKDRRVALSKTSQLTKGEDESAPLSLVPIVEEVISESEEEQSDSEEEKDLDNSKLHGKLGTLTEMSLDRCSSLLQDFLQLGTKGSRHFMRHLFGPIWHCLSNTQGGIDKEIAWSYCKSKGQKLGSNHWYCPPKSKGAKGEFGIDYFTTGEAVVSHILRELKEYHEFVKCVGNDQEVVTDLEMKLSHAIEQHIPFDEIRNTSASDTKFGTRRTTVGETLRMTKSPSPRHSKRTHDETRTIVSASDTTIKTSHKSPSKFSKNNCGETKTAKSVTFSQNTIEGAEILMQINKFHTEYENFATPSGIEELLKFRKRRKLKRKAVEMKEDRSPQKREKVLSPAAMCHLTQADDESVAIQSPHSRRLKSADKKHSPLYGLLFFGSGVMDDLKKVVEQLGGTYLNDVSGNYLHHEMVKKKMFFLSDVKFRRTHKYILASALGVPMLNMNWITALQKLYGEFNDKGGMMPSAFDSRLYSRHR
eukprot:scaffold4445_cov262-Chaetoceros_neogracile.AAC.8